MDGIPELVAYLTIGTSIIGITGFVIGNSRSEASKRQRIYERMDDIKKSNEQTYVRKDVCELQHKYTNEALARIESKVDKLLQKNGLK